MVGKNKYDIAGKMDEHFNKIHNASPRPPIYFLSINEFKPNYVELMDPDYSNYYIFKSQLFCSDDYCIAVITWKHYDMLENEDSQERLSSELEVYFPYRGKMDERERARKSILKRFEEHINDIVGKIIESDPTLKDSIVREIIKELISR
jgi:hypothetical protein